MRRQLAEATVLGGTAVVGLFGVAAECTYAHRPPPPLAWALALTVVTVLALPLRRRFPVAVVVGILAACLVYHLVGYPGLAIAAAIAPACYTLVAEGDGRRSLLVGALAAAAVTVISFLPPASFNLGATTGIVTILVALLAMAEARRAWRFAADERLRAVTRESERRLVDERLTIARELHDVLAHTITLISVQAAAGLDALPARPDNAEEALRTIRGAAKEAMAELRSTVRVLREVDELAPQPRLDQVGQLVDVARKAGIDVDLTTSGDARELPAGVELAAYRVVQEALTNVVRHAHATAATVRIDHRADCLHVEVVDNGDASEPPVDGHGMIGMRERVRAVGGSFAAGPTPGGGFAVSARLDLGGAR
ncbi:sensor histidine kinase [Kutzneria chonburiensis]|uniref:histidine kinase n=1 Tax=Kutzneria chonburiensis TaxID=1483604 RepID=A0ABV6NAU9_9PSEU|nr:sensor histidine kinase [Kutzneria chonburiensis]